MAIDDRVDAVRAQYPDPDAPGAAAMEVAGLLPGLATKLLALVTHHFCEAERQARLNALLEAVIAEVRDVQADIVSINSRLNSAEFKEALIIAARENENTSNPQTQKNLATVLARSLTSTDWKGLAPDLAALIRDLAQLNAADIEVLKLLATTYKNPPQNPPYLHDTNFFTGRVGNVYAALTDWAIDVDDYHARCGRLTGFGLVIEVPRNPNESPDRYCFRPTSRGNRLAEALS